GRAGGPAGAVHGLRAERPARKRRGRLHGAPFDAVGSIVGGGPPGGGPPLRSARSRSAAAAGAHPSRSAPAAGLARWANRHGIDTLPAPVRGYALGRAIPPTHWGGVSRARA